MTALANAAAPALSAVVACLAASSAWRTFAAPATDADPRVYAGALAPPGTRIEQANGVAWPYAVVSGFAESDFLALGSAAGDVNGRVRVWSAGADERVPMQGAGVVRVALAALVVPGYRVWRIDTALDRVQTDPDGQATQAIVSITMTAEAL